MHLDPLTFEGFHWDAYLVFVIISVVLATIIKIVVAKTVRYLKHVRWMRLRSGGTLKKDLEAAFWLEKINRPDYQRIWRWSYAEQRKKHSGVNGEKKSGRLSRWAKRMMFVNVALVILVVIILVLSNIGGTIDPGGLFYTETATHIYVDGWANLSSYGASEPQGDWFFELNGTSRYGWYGGGTAALLMAVGRTDSAYSERDVFLNLKSLWVNDTTTYVKNVTWATYEPMSETYSVYTIDGSGTDNFGLPVKISGRGYIDVLLSIRFNGFYTYSYTSYLTLTSTGNEGVLYISGGYTSPCYGTSRCSPSLSSYSCVSPSGFC